MKLFILLRIAVPNLRATTTHQSKLDTEMRSSAPVTLHEYLYAA